MSLKRNRLSPGFSKKKAQYEKANSLNSFLLDIDKYGRNNYDYQEGTLVFIAPGQVIGVQPKVEAFEPKGWALLFDLELIRGTPLGKHIADYSFFS